MAKLILNDGTEITDVIDVSVGGFSKECTAEEMAQIFDELTVTALSKYELHDSEGTVVAVYTNKKASSCTYSVDGIASFYLSDIDLTEQRISALEDTIDALLLEDLGV